MWKVYRYAEKDVVDADGYVIYSKDTWYLVGDYDTIDDAASVVKHEIYLYNCTCQNGDANPKFKILSDFDSELDDQLILLKNYYIIYM